VLRCLSFPSPRAVTGSSILELSLDFVRRPECRIGVVYLSLQSACRWRELPLPEVPSVFFSLGADTGALIPASAWPPFPPRISSARRTPPVRSYLSFLPSFVCFFLDFPVFRRPMTAVFLKIPQDLPIPPLPFFPSSPTTRTAVASKAYRPAPALSRKHVSI